MVIAKNLVLNMLGRREIFFHQQTSVAKTFLRFAASAFNGCLKFLLLINNTHALATTTGRGLQQNGKTNTRSFFFQSCNTLVFSMITGYTGTPALLIISLALIFEPIASIASCDGPMNMIPSSLHRFANEEFSDKKPYPGEWHRHPPVWPLQ